MKSVNSSDKTIPELPGATCLPHSMEKNGMFSSEIPVEDTLPLLDQRIFLLLFK